MFQEELEKLQLRIVRNQEQLSLAEVQSQRLGEKLRTETIRAQEAEAKVVTLKNDLDAARSELAASRAISEKVPKLEQDLVAEQTKTRGLLESLSKVTEALEDQKRELSTLKGNLAEKRAQATALLEQLTPMEGLVQGLKDRISLDKVIEGYLDQLKGKNE